MHCFNPGQQKQPETHWPLLAHFPHFGTVLGLVQLPPPPPDDAGAAPPLPPLGLPLPLDGLGAGLPAFAASAAVTGQRPQACGVRVGQEHSEPPLGSGFAQSALLAGRHHGMQKGLPGGQSPGAPPAMYLDMSPPEHCRPLHFQPGVFAVHIPSLAPAGGFGFGLPAPSFEPFGGFAGDGAGEGLPSKLKVTVWKRPVGSAFFFSRTVFHLPSEVIPFNLKLVGSLSGASLAVVSLTESALTPFEK